MGVYTLWGQKYVKEKLLKHWFFVFFSKQKWNILFFSKVQD